MEAGDVHAAGPPDEPPGRQTKRERNRQHDWTRPGGHDRGYDNRWRRLSASYKSRVPLCERCSAQGRTESGEELHHVTPLKVDPTRKCDPTNTVHLCRFCHRQVEAGADLLVDPKANGQREWRF